MNDFIKQIIEEKFASKKQQRYFYHKAKKSKKWANMAKEFSDKTDFSKLPEKAAEEQKEVDEIVDADGNIRRGDEPGNPNQYITAKKTTDQVAKSTMGSMGSFGVLGGAPGHYKTLKYWAEADMSKALGADETILNPETDYEKAKEHLEKDLEVPEKEAEDRVEKMGYDPTLPDGKMRLIENPRNYIEEYLAKKGKINDLVRKEVPEEKKTMSPIIKRQIHSFKQTLKDNGLTVKDITEYLEDNEQ